MAARDAAAPLAPGATVEIRGLESEAFADLNGRTGTVCSWDGQLQRWKVRVDGRRKLLALHPQNLAALAEEQLDPLLTTAAPPHEGEGEPPPHAAAAASTPKMRKPSPEGDTPPPHASAPSPPHASSPPPLHATAATAKKPSPRRGKAAAKSPCPTLVPKKSSESDWEYLLRAADSAGNEIPFTVGARGLPPGALASGPRGFEVRSLSGAVPLPSHQSVAAAMKKLSRGEDQAATAAVRHDDVTSIRAFCRTWHELWRIPVPPSLAGGAELSDTARRRLVESAAAGARRGALPGRLVVVSAGNAARPDGAPLVPPSLVDVEFESGAALHEAVGAEVATLDMTVCADPSWVSAAVMQQRIAAAGRVAQPQLLCALAWDGRRGVRVRFDRFDAQLAECAAAAGTAWALVEGTSRGACGVLLHAPAQLVAPQTDARGVPPPHPAAAPPADEARGGVLPPLTSEARAVKLPASLLQKAIRRSTALCSAAPVLEACAALLGGGVAEPPRGGPRALFWTIACCMLADVCPFEASSDGRVLGICELIGLALAALADPSWIPPLEVQRMAVATALRLQRRRENEPWVGFLRHPLRDEQLHSLEASPQAAAGGEAEGRARLVRDALRVGLLAMGGSRQRGRWGKVLGDRPTMAFEAYLHPEFTSWQQHLDPPPPVDDESALLQAWPQPPAAPADERVARLDEECRLVSFDSIVCPSILLLLQASLGSPPVNPRKHSLPALACHANNLSAEANPREKYRTVLARVAEFRGGTAEELTYSAAGASAAQPDKSSAPPPPPAEAKYTSHTQVVTTTGVLSPPEQELACGLEAIQRHAMASRAAPPPADASGGAPAEAVPIRSAAGRAPTAYEARTAFLLLFGAKAECELSLPDGSSETAWVLFAGDAQQPLLVQRMGKAHEAAAAAGGGYTAAGGSGAFAVRSLGFVARGEGATPADVRRAAEEEAKAAGLSGEEARQVGEQAARDRQLCDAAEAAVHTRWAGGRVVHAPMAPPGFQWDFGGAPGGEEEAEAAVHLTARRDADGKWHFSAAGREVEPFDAGRVLSRCSQPSEVRALDDARRRLIEQALYAAPAEDAACSTVDLLSHLSGLAAEERRQGAREGLVYDWSDVGAASRIRCGAWRDALLALTTREADDVAIAPPLADGSACARAMSEGVVLRVFYALEALYPSALRRVGAMRWRVRPRGAAYQHLVGSLQRLGRGDLSSSSQVDCAAAGEAPRDGDGLWLPEILTPLWEHQRRAHDAVLSGVRDGKRGFADASAVGAGKTLTALAISVSVAEHLAAAGQRRSGILVMLPTPALLSEWLREVAKHTRGYHVIEQRKTGELWSITFAKMNPPLDGNSLVITTLDRVRDHPFVTHAAWDFVIIDECLSVQNVDAKRCPSAWRQIEVSSCGCLMLSATFFRSAFDKLFYMIRMLRSPLPRTMEFLPTLIHEHVVCEVPETGRTWDLSLEPVPLPAESLAKYCGELARYERHRLQTGEADGRKLWTRLEAAVRELYVESGLMTRAFAGRAAKLIKEGRRPILFANTEAEAEAMLDDIPHSRRWGEAGSGPIVVNRFTHSQGINMQAEGDAIICRPTPGDLLEQMKGRIDRPGQREKKLILVVLMAQHTIEEAQAANIHLCGNFFRNYLAPVARRFEEVSLEAALAVMPADTPDRAGPRKNQVFDTWRHVMQRGLESSISADANGEQEASSAECATPRSDTTATICAPATPSTDAAACAANEAPSRKRQRPRQASITPPRGKRTAKMPHAEAMAPVAPVACGDSPCGSDSNVAKMELDGDSLSAADANDIAEEERAAVDPAGLTPSLKRKGDSQFFARASPAVKRWLKPPKVPAAEKEAKRAPFAEFSDREPPLVLDRPTINKALQHLSENDPKMARLISRVGAHALAANVSEVLPPDKVRLFDVLLKSITFSMISVESGNAILRKLAKQVSISLDAMRAAGKEAEVEAALQGTSRNTPLSTDETLEILRAGTHGLIRFSPLMLKATTTQQLSGKTKPSARESELGFVKTGSCGYSGLKARFIHNLVDDFESGRVSAEELDRMSDRKVAKLLCGEKGKKGGEKGIDGIGPWCAGRMLMDYLVRADVMLYGDLTIRNYLNDMYDIGHVSESETAIQSSADFDDTPRNRNLIDAVAEKNGWAPYRSVVGLLMYHLQEDNLVLV